MLTLQFEGEGKQTAVSGSYKGQDYWTFTIRFPFPNGALVVKGWQYYPSTGQLGAPRIPRGKDRVPFTSAWIVGALFEEVRQQVQDHFVVVLKVCREPWETRQPAEAASEEPLEEYQKRYEHWDMVAGANGLRGEEAEAFIQKKMKRKKR